MRIRRGENAVAEEQSKDSLTGVGTEAGAGRTEHSWVCSGQMRADPGGSSWKESDPDF